MRKIATLERLHPLLLLDDVPDGALERQSQQTEEPGGARPPLMLRHLQRRLCRVRRDRERLWLVPLREHRTAPTHNQVPPENNQRRHPVNP